MIEVLEVKDIQLKFEFLKLVIKNVSFLSLREYITLLLSKGHP
jgi:hypothetical protein